MPNSQKNKQKNKRKNRHKKKHADLLKKKKKTGTIYVQNTTNNTIITLTDSLGNPKYWTSSGCLGFKNSRKSTTYAAQVAAEKLAKTALKFGFFSVKVKIKGLGFSKRSCVRTLFKSGLKITRIEATTPITHNGCRPPKKRRV